MKSVFTEDIFTDAERASIEHRVDDVRCRLLGNIVTLQQHKEPVLLVGECYPGIWLEHNQDNLFLAEYDPAAAWGSQTAFMEHQREDGLLPFALPLRPFVDYFQTNAAYWHVQCVYSFPRCALEIARKTGRPESDYRRIYDVGRRYDDWFGAYRNRSGNGLAEMYCEYDTGHDNAPRVTDGGIPHTCPRDDANNMPDLPVMPVLSVDLSAMLYGSRMALAELAELLELPREAAVWRSKAATLKAKMRELLYDSVDDFYYDRDRHGLRKYRTEHITRLFLNGVLEQDEFDRIYSRYFEDTDEFLTPFPFSSVSVSDPHYDREAKGNSWGAHTQALTALRALLWLRDYGRERERRALLLRWMTSFQRHGRFPQELNPFDGSPIGEGKNYTPALILFLEGAKELRKPTDKTVNRD